MSSHQWHFPKLSLPLYGSKLLKKHKINYYTRFGYYFNHVKVHTTYMVTYRLLCSVVATVRYARRNCYLDPCIPEPNDPCIPKPINCELHSSDVMI